MNGEERRRSILDHLREVETETVEALAIMFGVSGMTIHRDLDVLERSNLVRKIRGGATIVPSVIFEGDYAYREVQNFGLKKALARDVVQLIEPGMAVMFDDSSTVAEIAPLLKSAAPLTVVTHSLPVLRELENVEDISLICLGGVLDPLNKCYVGMLTEKTIRSMRVDLAIFSAACVHGVTAYQRDTDDIVRVKHAMMSSSDRHVLVVDHTKFGKSALYRFAPLDAFEQIYVTDGLAEAECERLAAANINIKLVSAQSTGSQPT